MTDLMRHCAICSDERRFEQPPCVDEHDLGCPEWVCVDCGAALLMGVLEVTPVASVA
ncbi:MAG: hypothetical protein ACR2J0_03215 [Mycobacteriales bacterium]|jgi:hypothetical protein